MLATTVSMVKIDQDLFGVFDNTGSIRFLSFEDIELVKFRARDESAETADVLPLL